MSCKQICGWCLLAVISCSAAVSIRDTVTATIGDPFVLSFDYSGSQLGVSYRYSKDGMPFVPEKPRVLQRPGRLSFLEITDEDAGVYQLEVEDYYNNAINLSGTYACIFTDNIQCMTTYLCKRL